MCGKRTEISLRPLLGPPLESISFSPSSSSVKLSLCFIMFVEDQMDVLWSVVLGKYTNIVSSHDQ